MIEVKIKKSPIENRTFINAIELFLEWLFVWR